MRVCSIRTGVLLVALGLVLASLPGSAVAQVAAHDEFARQLANVLPGYMDRYNVPGVSVALVEGGEVVYVGNFGLADVENQVPVRSDTAYQVASVSKCLTAWGVLKLVDDGLVGLDDPVERYLTRWHIPPSPYDSSGVTVRRLLQHRAGISLSGYGSGRTPDEPLPTLEASLLGDTRGCGKVELVCEPGTRFMYSGGGYTILQLLVEEVTGQAFADYMRQSVLQPLGMTHSTFVWDQEVQGRLARGYGSYYNAIPNYRYVEDAAGGLYSTVTDMARYAQAVIDGSDVLSRESLALLFQGQSYGLGHGLVDWPTGQRLVFGGGTRMGWQSDFVTCPAEGCGIVVLSNANGGIIMNLEIINRWVEWKTGVSWPGAELFTFQYPVLVALALALGIACAAYTLYLAWQFRRGRRVLLFQSPHHWKTWRVALVALLVGAVVLWWLFGFTDVFDPQAKMLWLPAPFLYVSVCFTWLMLAVGVGNLFPRRRQSKGARA